MSLQYTWETETEERAQECAESMRLSSEDALSAQFREQEQLQIATDSEIHKIDVGVAYLSDKAAGVSGKSCRDTVSADSHVAAPSSLHTLPAGFNMQMPVSAAAYQQQSARAQGQTFGGMVNCCFGTSQLADLATLNQDTNASETHNRTKQKAVGIERTRSSEWACVFNIRKRDSLAPCYEADALLSVAEQLAKKLRPHVIMPALTSTDACVHKGRY